MADFDGASYDPERDRARLEVQLYRTWAILRDYHWHTLFEIAEKIEASPQSVSARIRDFRKPKFGGHTIEKEYVHKGLWQYRLVPPDEDKLIAE